MLSVYVGCLLFGGVLLAASVFGGHDHDAGGGDVDHGGEHHGDHGGLPFVSLRFWAFSIAFFGLAGAALALAGVGRIAAVVAGGFGLSAGYISWRVLRSLARESIGLVRDGAANVGREGRLLLPVGKGQRGKLRLTVAGTSVDLLAETDGDEALGSGETVLIVGMRGNVALVERNPAVRGPGEPAPPAAGKEGP
jgi:membrane protein implicated in regulation of membrane protease activity